MDERQRRLWRRVLTGDSNAVDGLLASLERSGVTQRSAWRWHESVLEDGSEPVARSERRMRSACFGMFLQEYDLHTFLPGVSCLRRLTRTRHGANPCHYCATHGGGHDAGWLDHVLAFARSGTRPAALASQPYIKPNGTAWEGVRAFCEQQAVRVVVKPTPHSWYAPGRAHLIVFLRS